MTKYIEIDKAIDIVGGYFMVDNDAERFLEDEMRENGTDLIDRVLEIIDEVIGRDVEYAKDENDEAWKKCIKRSIDTAFDIRDAVKALKGEQDGEED